MSELKLLKLEDRRLYLDLMEVFKLINGLTNYDRKELFELKCDNPRRGLVSNDCPNNIVIKRCNLEIRRNFFTSRVPEHWNDLPDDLKMTLSLQIFKSDLKTHLIAKYLDHPQTGEAVRQQ